MKDTAPPHQKKRIRKRRKERIFQQRAPSKIGETAKLKGI
jgi:hypothetical protein